MNLEFFFDNAWRWKEDLAIKYDLKPLGWNHIPPLESLRASEENPKFNQFRLNRKVMGAFRYELFQNKSKKKYDYLGRSLKLLEEYQKTGNDELLLDIANYMELEFTFGTHPLKHFNASDDQDHCKLHSI